MFAHLIRTACVITALVTFGVGAQVATVRADAPPKLQVSQSCEAAARGAVVAGRDKEACLADENAAACQSASDRDPGSASKRDPPFLRFERLALAPSELIGVTETGRARVVG